MDWKNRSISGNFSAARRPDPDPNHHSTPTTPPPHHPTTPPPHPLKIFRNLTFRVLIAIALGVILGVAAPGTAKAMRPLGDTFVNLVKMVIAPIIFLTIVLGIANMADLKKVGKVGAKALIYFEIVTTFALTIGLVIVNITKPGAGIDASGIVKGDVSKYAEQGKAMSVVEFFTHIIPTSFVEPFVKGEIIQVVFVAVLFGVALTAIGPHGAPVTTFFDRVLQVFFKVVHYIMVVAPIGAFGAMAFTIGNFGLKSLLPLGRLMLDVYATMFLFVFVVLNLIARAYRFSLWEYLKFIREEIVLVLGTSSSEAALPPMIDKMERYGCSKTVVGLVIPAGYSFNLDGTSIYLSMASIFIAQVFGIDLSIGQQVTLLAVLMVTSKGAAGVTGSGFIVLASTLTAMGTVPVEGLALVLGVDRFMSEARAIVNLIGNGVATIVIAKSEGSFDETRRVLAVEEIKRLRLAGAE
jgi:aerobic C4-dicarboxylate transport protein